MNNMFAPDSRFMILCAKLVELTCINLMWMLCCLPIFTIGASTKAMLSTLYDMNAGNACGIRVFLKHFKKDFGKTTIIWLLILFLGIMLAVDYYLVANMEFPGRMAVIVAIFFVAFALILFAGMVFPLLSQFPGTVKETVVNAILLSVANLPKMLLVTAMNLLPVLLFLLLPQIFLLLGFLLLICGFSLMAMYDIKVIEPIFAPFRTQTEA